MTRYPFTGHHVDEQRRARLLLLGARGQVGWELTRALAPLGELQSRDRSSVDLSDLDAVRAAVRSARADVIVNAAAYTNVDRAEAEKAAAHRINAEAPAVLAEEAALLGALLVHYSTDYVFDGANTRPYAEEDATRPLNAYGSSKLEGDEAILKSDAEAYVFRIGWVYGRRGRNFLETMERLARERDELRVVADQHGSPTWCRTIADATAIAIGQWLAGRRTGAKFPPRGLYHMAAPDHASWYDFALAIVSSMSFPEGRRRPLVNRITTSEYPTAALRPQWTVLNSSRLFQVFGLALPPWRTQLALCLDQQPQ
jgi:dTDP-4-dehydrorhamnose reductase